MALLVDCSSAVDGAALIAAGYMGAIRYLSKYPAHVIREAERDGLLAAGADIVLVYEDVETDALMGGVGGANAAYRIIKQAGDLGAPAGLCVYLACDANYATADQVRPYYAAAKPILAESGYGVGIYGPQGAARGLLEDGTVDKAWVVETWQENPPGSLDPFHLMQLVKSAIFVGGTKCDENQILRVDYGGWLAGLNPAAPPAPPVVIHYPEDHVMLIKITVVGIVNGRSVSTDANGWGSTIVPGISSDRFQNAFPNGAGYVDLPQFHSAQDENGQCRINWKGSPLSPPFEAHIWVTE